MLDPARIREFVIAGHGNLSRVKAMLAEEPALLNAAHEWKPGDTESAIQGAAHVGNAAIAEYLLSRGAPLELPTAATLGRYEDIKRMLVGNPALIKTTGAHGIPLLAHVVFSGDPALVAVLFERGATEGQSMALAQAAGAGHTAVVKWLLEFADPDLAWTNMQGKTALDVALARNDIKTADLLRSYGAETAAG